MSTGEGVTWETRFPLLTNRYFLLDIGKAVFVTMVVFTVLIGVITRDVEDTIWFTGVTGAVMVVLVTIACLLLGNGYNASFSVGHGGISYASGKTEQRWNRAAIILGLLAGKPGVAGAGMLGSAGESGSYTWSEIDHVVVDRERRVISLHNNWRMLNRLYCTPENFTGVLAEFERRLPKSKVKQA